jgi:hypothetical protein
MFMRTSRLPGFVPDRALPGIVENKLIGTGLGSLSVKRFWPNFTFPVRRHA